MSTVLKQVLTVTILFQSDPKPVCLTNTNKHIHLQIKQQTSETYAGLFHY